MLELCFDACCSRIDGGFDFIMRWFSRFQFSFVHCFLSSERVMCCEKMVDPNIIAFSFGLRYCIRDLVQSRILLRYNDPGSRRIGRRGRMDSQVESRD